MRGKKNEGKYEKIVFSKAMWRGESTLQWSKIVVTNTIF
jgi:hypothetical protein